MGGWTGGWVVVGGVWWVVIFFHRCSFATIHRQKTTIEMPTSNNKAGCVGWSCQNPRFLQGNRRTHGRPPQTQKRRRTQENKQSGNNFPRRSSSCRGRGAKLHGTGLPTFRPRSRTHQSRANKVDPTRGAPNASRDCAAGKKRHTRAARGAAIQQRIH